MGRRVAAAHARSGARGGGVARRSHPAYAHHAADVAFHRGGGRAVDAAPVGTADPRRQCVVRQRQWLRVGRGGLPALQPVAGTDTRRGQPPHAAADRRGAGTSRNGRRRTAVESSDDARRNGRRGLQRCRQGGKTYLCAVGGTGAAGGRSAGRGSVGPAGASLFPQPFSGDVRRFRLVVGVARRAGPPRCRGAGRGVASRIVRRAGVSAARELGDLPKGAGARAPVAGVRRVSDRLQGSFGRAGTGASCAGIQRLRCFPAGAAARRPDRGAVGPQGNAGRRGAVRR